MVASLEVHTNDGVSIETQVYLEDLERDIVIVHLIVAKGDVNIDGMIILVLDQEFLVNLSGLFEMTSKVMESSHTQLIFNRVRKCTMIAHDLVFISRFLSELEQKSVFKLRVLTFLGFDLRLFELIQSVKATSFKGVKIRIIIISLHKIIINIHRLLIISIVEGAVSDTHISFKVVPL